MKRMSLHILNPRNRLLTSAAAVTLLAAVQAASGAATIDFNRDIRPLLSDNCFSCHGPDASHRKAKLRLDVEEGATSDLGGYQAVAPGQPEASELIARINASDPDDLMPPPDSGKSLADEEKRLLRAWIQSGAPWAQHWAYVPPTRHPVPAARDASWPLSWVDDFIMARLEAEGLSPAPEADRVTLIRRLTFDLTGLPPTPAEVKDFLEDRSEDDYERVVDRLLRSPGFGERMATYWLDLVRYADTVGYHAVENIVHVRDLHATMLHMLGIDPQRFSVPFQGLDMRLTGVEEAPVVHEVLG